MRTGKLWQIQGGRAKVGNRGGVEAGKLGMPGNRGEPRVGDDRCGSGVSSGGRREGGKGGTAGERLRKCFVVGGLGKWGQRRV